MSVAYISSKKVFSIKTKLTMTKWIKMTLTIHWRNLIFQGEHHQRRVYCKCISMDEVNPKHFSYSMDIPYIPWYTLYSMVYFWREPFWSWNTDWIKEIDKTLQLLKKWWTVRFLTENSIYKILFSWTIRFCLNDENESVRRCQHKIRFDKDFWILRCFFTHAINKCQFFFIYFIIQQLKSQWFWRTITRQKPANIKYQKKR